MELCGGGGGRTTLSHFFSLSRARVSPARETLRTRRRDPASTRPCSSRPSPTTCRSSWAGPLTSRARTTLTSSESEVSSADKPVSAVVVRGNPKPLLLSIWKECASRVGLFSFSGRYCTRYCCVVGRLVRPYGSQKVAVCCASSVMCVSQGGAWHFE